MNTKIINRLKEYTKKYNDERAEQSPCIEDLYYYKGAIDAINEICEAININSKASLTDRTNPPHYFISPCFLDEANMAEFKGQIIDVFEDYLAEKDISIPSDERPDDESSAILYGDYYDRIADEVAFICEKKTQDDKMPIKLDYTECEILKNNVEAAFEDIIKEANMQLSESEQMEICQKDIELHKTKIQQILNNWNVCT